MASGVLRRAAALLLFALILAGSIQNAAEILKRFDRPPPPDDYDRFLAEVLSRTRPGHSIVVVARTDTWKRYSPSFGPAFYRLSGRTVLPAMSEDGRLFRQHLRDADYAAVWKVPPPPDRPVLWRDATGNGVLAGR